MAVETATPQPSSRLPEGWDSELQAINNQIAEVSALRESLSEEMKAAMEAVRLSYVARMPHDRLAKLGAEKEQAWQRIRDSHPIAPLEIDMDPTSIGRVQAAKILAHYWQGEEIDSYELMMGIMGYRSPDWNTKAYEYALNLTQPNSPERLCVMTAQEKLWEGTGR